MIPGNVSRLASRVGVLCAIVLTCGATRGADWPQWRGPMRDNLSKETNLLTAWPDGGPRLAWKATGIGDGYAGVSVVGGRVYTMGEDKSSSYIRALDEKSGKIVWSAKVGAVGGGEGYPGPRSTPTVDGDRVYALGQFGDLVCVSVDGGKEFWRKNLKKDFNGAMMSGWGYAESVLIDGEKLICTPGGKDGTLAALEKKTGNVIWRSKDWTSPAAYSSVVIATFAGKRAYVQLTGDDVAGIDPETGKSLWAATRKGPTAVIPTPICFEDRVFVTSGYNAGGDLFKITNNHNNDKSLTAETVYHTNDLGVHVGGVVLIDGFLYGVNNNFLSCIDFKTGKLQWKNRSVGKGAVTYADKHLYVRADATPGSIALVDASPKKYVENGQFAQPDGSGKNTWPPIVIANGKMYLRDQNVLLCYDVERREAANAR